jgi:ABC-2 type transport system ATP-binding protein
MLELIKLSKTFGSHKAVDELTLEVERGEILGLLGPNGAGKSTTVAMVATLLKPTSGDIRLAGRSLYGEETAAKKRMGIVPQDIALYDALTAKENLSFFGCMYGLSGRELQNRVDQTLDIIGLREHMNRDVRDLSGGMKRRVNMGAALMNAPDLLILDEPTVGIDPQSRRHILESVKLLNRERGMTVIYTSHYMEEVEFLCRRVAVMDHGKLIALGTKEELKRSLGAWDAIIVDCDGAGPEQLARAERIPGVKGLKMEQEQLTMYMDPRERNPVDVLDELRHCGLRLTSFRYEEVNLEHLFLQMTGKSLRD